MASRRVKRLMTGLREVLGEEVLMKTMENALTAEEIAVEAGRHSIHEIDTVLADARLAGAAKWSWVRERFRSGPRGAKTA